MDVQCFLMESLINCIPTFLLVKHCHFQDSIGKTDIFFGSINWLYQNNIFYRGNFLYHYTGGGRNIAAGQIRESSIKD